MCVYSPRREQWPRPTGHGPQTCRPFHRANQQEISVDDQMSMAFGVVGVVSVVLFALAIGIGVYRTYRAGSKRAGRLSEDPEIETARRRWQA